MSEHMPFNKQKSLILFFIDGLGIGEPNSDNPLFSNKDTEPLRYWKNGPEKVFGNGTLIHTDACLGIEGRPQSASGQTTIYTGSNAPKLLGYHKQGFPNAALRELIQEKSIFKQIAELGLGNGIFANAYTPQFFEKTPRWKSATTCSVEAAGLQFCRLPDLVGRKSVFHDFTNRSLIERGFDVPEFSPRTAAEILVGLAQRYSFVLYEHFITDKIGHSQDWDGAKAHLPELAEFVRETVKLVDPERTTLVLTSDHGNIEDLSIRNHTLNKVPTVVWGRNHREFARRISSLVDITPAILNTLSQ